MERTATSRSLSKALASTKSMAGLLSEDEHKHAQQYHLLHPNSQAFANWQDESVSLAQRKAEYRLEQLLQHLESKVQAQDKPSKPHVASSKALSGSRARGVIGTMVGPSASQVAQEALLRIPSRAEGLIRNAALANLFNLEHFRQQRQDKIACLSVPPRAPAITVEAEVLARADSLENSAKAPVVPELQGNASSSSIASGNIGGSDSGSGGSCDSIDDVMSVSRQVRCVLHQLQLQLQQVRRSMLDRWSTHLRSSEDDHRFSSELHRRLRVVESQIDDVTLRLQALDDMLTRADADSPSPNLDKLDPSVEDVIVLLRYVMTRQGACKDLHRYLRTLRWLNYTHRFDVYVRSRQLLVANTCGDDSDVAVVPVLTTELEDLEAQIEELRDVYAIPAQVNDNDGHEMFYHVNKKFVAVFDAQSEASTFPVIDAAASRVQLHVLAAPEAAALPGDKHADHRGGTAGKRGGARSVRINQEQHDDKQSQEAVRLHNDTTLLKHSAWKAYQKIWPQQTLSQRQGRVLQAQMPIDDILRVENGFLQSNDQAYVVKRFKELAETHASRASVAKGSGGSGNASDGDDERGGTPRRRSHRRHAEDETHVEDETELARRAAVAAFIDEQAIALPRHKILALYYLRHVFTRGFRSRILHTLNYFASLQRRFVIDGIPSDDPIYEGTPSPAGQGRRRKSSRDADDGAGSDAESGSDSSDSDESDVEERDAAGARNNNDNSNSTSNTMLGDVYERSADEHVRVKDYSGRYIMYDSAVQEWDELQAQLLVLGTHFLAQRERSLRQQRSQHQRGRRAASNRNVDGQAMLRDLYASESWFQEAKRMLVDVLFQAYELCSVPADRARLAQRIVTVMYRRPRVDMTAEYFTESYASEIVALELELSLMREVIKHQQRREREQVHALHTRGRSIGSMLGLPLPPVKLPSRPALYTEGEVGCDPVTLLDSFDSIGAICELPDILDTLMNEAVELHQPRDHASEIALHRTILQQALVEWRVLIENDAICHESPSVLGASFDVLVEDPVAMAAIIEESVPRNRRIGQFPRNAVINAVRVVRMRHSLLLALHETELLADVYQSQARLVGSRDTSPCIDPVDWNAIESGILDAAGVSRGRNPSDSGSAANAAAASEPTAVSTEPLVDQAVSAAQLAMAELDARLCAFDFTRGVGIRHVLAYPNMLCRTLDVQAAARNLLIVAVQRAQVPLDPLWKDHLQQLEKLTARIGAPSVFITVNAASQLSEKQQESVTRAVDHEQRLFRRRVVACTKHLVPLAELKRHARARIIKLFSDRATQLASSAPAAASVQPRLQTLSLDLAHSYSNDLLQRVRIFALQTELWFSVQQVRRQTAEIGLTPEQYMYSMYVKTAEEREDLKRRGEGDADDAEDGDSNDAHDTDGDSKTGRQTDSPDTSGNSSDDDDGGDTVQGGKEASTNSNGKQGTGGTTEYPVPRRIDDDWRQFISADGRISNVWYLPSFDTIANMMPAAPPDMVISNLTSGVRVMRALRDILALVHANALLSLSPRDAITQRQAALPTVRVQLLQLHGEQRNLVIPANPQHVESWLQGKRDMLYAKQQLMLRNLLDNLLASDKTGAAKLVEQAITSTTSAPQSNPPQPHHLPQLHPWYAWVQGTSTDGLLAYRGARPAITALVHPSSLLLDLNGADRNYAHGEDMGVDLLLDDLLTLNNTYATSQPEKATQQSQACLATSLALWQLRRFYMRAKLGIPERESMTPAQYRNGRSIYEHTVLPVVVTQVQARSSQGLASAAVRTDHLRSEVARQIDAEVGDERVSAARAAVAPEMALRQCQVAVLRQEIDVLLIQQSLNRVTALLHQHAIEAQTNGSALDGKADIVATFLRRVLTHARPAVANAAGAATAPDSAPEVVLSIAELGNACDDLARALALWQAQAAGARDASFARHQAALRHALYQQEQSTRQWKLLWERERRDEERRVQAEVTDRGYDLIFEIDRLHHELSEMQERLKTQGDDLRASIKAEYDGLVRELTSKVATFKGRFLEYRAQLYSDMVDNLMDVKKEALEKVVDSDNTPVDLKQQTMKQAKMDQDIREAQSEVRELSKALLKIRTMNRLKDIAVRSTYERKLDELQGERKIANKSLYSNKLDVERREHMLRQQLSSTQRALTDAEAEVARLSKELTLQQRNKLALVQWKVSKSQMLDELESKVAQYERWNHVNVDKLLLDLQRKEEEVKKLTGGVVTGVKHTEMAESRASKDLRRLQQELAHEKALKRNAFARLDETRARLQDTELQLARIHTDRSNALDSGGSGSGVAGDDLAMLEQMYGSSAVPSPVDVERVFRDNQRMYRLLASSNLLRQRPVSRHTTPRRGQTAPTTATATRANPAMAHAAARLTRTADAGGGRRSSAPVALPSVSATVDPSPRLMRFVTPAESHKAVMEAMPRRPQYKPLPVRAIAAAGTRPNSATSAQDDVPVYYPVSGSFSAR